MEYMFELKIKMDIGNGKSIDFRKTRRGTDYGNVCKRFMAETDMHDLEIVRVRKLYAIGG